ncbi:MAG TPA: aminopeptidase P family N-terminal domain-containing protein, partial [Actinomycetes bacterium]|nr:aminopeptidase P family N-terminal domain-containing protein [Actinomycetes bacterium]
MEAAIDRGRLTSAQSAAAESGIDALLVTPGPDLKYLTGYDAVALERLTCLVVPAKGEPCLVAPRLEVAAAQASPLGRLGVQIHGWGETDDPYALVAKLVGDASNVGLSNSMTALAVLRLRDAMPAIHQRLAGDVMRQLRMIKDAGEVAELRHAARAIDRVHEQVPDLLRPGRTER